MLSAFFLYYRINLLERAVVLSAKLRHTAVFRIITDLILQIAYLYRCLAQAVIASAAAWARLSGSAWPQ